MPRVGFEPTTPVFERAKTVNTSDRAATVIGAHIIIPTKKLSKLYNSTTLMTLKPSPLNLNNYNVIHLTP
jgi:hypothetical protein